MYRWDEQTQSIRFFPDDEGDYDPNESGYTPPDRGSIAPGYQEGPQYGPAYPGGNASPVLTWSDQTKSVNFFGSEHELVPMSELEARDYAGQTYRDAGQTYRRGSKLPLPAPASSAAGGVTYGPVQYDAYGRPYQVDSRGQVHQLSAPPSAPQGRDLRMSDSEVGNLAARREELGVSRDRLGFDREKEANDKEYQDAQIELSRATQEFNREKELAAQKQNEIANEIDRAKLAQDDRAQQALEAYRDQQLALDRQRIDQAERQMAEAAKQFAATDQRLRRAQALAELEAGQRAEAEYIDRFGHSRSWYGNAPGFGRITPEDVSRMAG